MESLAKDVAAGNRRAIARAISLLEEDEDEVVRAQLTTTFAQMRNLGRPPVHVVGLTGAPGTGKSSLGDRLITHARSLHQRVAVIAVDPSSPFTGGAVLGDRVRMNRHATDPGVFIRSMGTRGSLGGLSRGVGNAVRVLSAAPFDVIFVETVGVGQSELDVMYAADTVVVVVTPAGGDQVQAAKAGIMEIAHVFAVNKADLAGADRAVRALEDMVAHRAQAAEGWAIEVVKTSAASGEGVSTLWEVLETRYEFLQRTGELAARRARERGRELTEAVMRLSKREIDRRLVEDPVCRGLYERVKTDELTPSEAAVRIVRRFFNSGVFDS